MREKTMYVLRVHQPDGSWKFDLDEPMTKREAEHLAARNRILLGVLCQIWPQKEAAKVAEARPSGMAGDTGGTK